VTLDAQRNPCRRRLRVGFAVSLVAIHCCNLAFTALLDLVGWYRPPESYRLRHPVYHHGLEPMVSNRPTEWGRLSYEVSTNSLGMRNREARVVPLRSERPRILLLGDSLTEGVSSRAGSGVHRRLHRDLGPGQHEDPRQETVRATGAWNLLGNLLVG
jgi:hypothetical protein